MEQDENITHAFVIKAEELSALNYLNSDHVRPLYFQWINRGTDQKLRQMTVELLLRTLFQEGTSPSVARLQQSAGLRLVFQTLRERDSFATAFGAARAEEGFREGHLVTAVFDDREAAEQAVAELKAAGIPESSVSLLWRADPLAESQARPNEGHSKLSVAAAVAGGGLAGTLLGVAVLAIPGIGPVAAAGAIVASANASVASVSAIIGATGGALARMLSDKDVSDQSANYYEKQIKRGRVFVSIDTRLAEGQNEIVRQVLVQSGGHTGRRSG